MQFLTGVQKEITPKPFSFDLESVWHISVLQVWKQTTHVNQLKGFYHFCDKQYSHYIQHPVWHPYFSRLLLRLLHPPCLLSEYILCTTSTFLPATRLSRCAAGPGAGGTFSFLETLVHLQSLLNLWASRFQKKSRRFQRFFKK